MGAALTQIGNRRWRRQPTWNRYASAAKGAAIVAEGLVLKRDVYYTLEPAECDYVNFDGEAQSDSTEFFELLSDPKRFSALEHQAARDYVLGPGRYLMLGDNSPWSRDARAWGQSDRFDPEYPQLGWDRVGPVELGGSRIAADRQGLLRLLAPSQARLATNSGRSGLSFAYSSVYGANAVYPLESGRRIKKIGVREHRKRSFGPLLTRPKIAIDLLLRFQSVI